MQNKSFEPSEVASNELIDADLHRLFEKVDAGVALCGLIRGADGAPIDYCLNSANAAFRRRFSLSDADREHRLPGDVMSATTAAVLATAVEAVETQTSRHLEQHVDDGDRWIAVEVIPLGDDRFAQLVTDITDRTDAEATLRRERERLHALVDTMPAAVFIADADGGIVYTNEQATQIWGGIPPTATADEYGLYKGWWPATGERLRAADWAGARALDGEITHGEIVEIERFDGARATILNSSAPIRSAEDELVGAVTVELDITEHSRVEAALRVSEQRFALLNEANALLLSTDDPEGAIQTIAEKVMAFLGADVFFNYVLDPGATRLRLNAWGGVDERVAKMIERLDLGQAICGCVARDGERIISCNVQTNGDERADLVRRMGVRCYVCHPIRVGHDTVGTLSFGTKSKDAFSEEEISLMRTVTDQVSVAVHKYRMYEVQRSIAEALQETLVVMPHAIPGVVFSRAYQAATVESGRVGGDFVDVFEAGENLVGISLGDVSGKGIEAAVTTSSVRTTLRVHAIDGQSPAVVAAKANEVMRRLTKVESYVTLWFGLLNTQTGLLRYICAGHPPALVLADGAVTELECKDPILGAFDEAAYYESQTILRAGERLVLYSDGATEARSPGGDFLSTEGFYSDVSGCAGLDTDSLASALMDRIVDYSARVLRDDLAILVIEPTHLDEGVTATGSE